MSKRKVLSKNQHQRHMGVHNEKPQNKNAIAGKIIIFASATIILAWLISFLAGQKGSTAPQLQFEELRMINGLVYISGENILYTGTAVSFYTNRQLKAKVQFQPGKEDGLYEIWYEDGTLMHQAGYVMGIFSGSVKWWAPDGSLALEMTYLNGQETELISHSDFTVPINAIPQIAE